LRDERPSQADPRRTQPEGLSPDLSEGVEPTNNAGERSLRHAVIWRKLSFGTQNASGSRFVETILTVIETCRQQTRNVYSFLTAAVEAHLAHHPAPSLLSEV